MNSTLAEEPPANTAASSSSGAAEVGEPVSLQPEKEKRDPRYPLSVAYCPYCSLPAELHEYVSKKQFETCKPWLRKHGPQFFPNVFPEECAARLEAIRLAEESGAEVVLPDADDDQEENHVKVAVPIKQNTSGGKKKKPPAEIVLALGQRKGKKQVTIVYGLDMFGIKLKDASKLAKNKLATGASTAVSPDNRDVVEIQGSRQKDFAEIIHKKFFVPKEDIYFVNAQKKKVKAFP